MTHETKTIPFTLDAWQELVVDEKTHHLEMIVLSRSKHYPARIVDTRYESRSGKRILVVIKMDGNDFETHTQTFNPDNGNDGSGWQLTIVPNPPKSLGWVRIWKIDETGECNAGAIFETKEQAFQVSSYGEFAGVIHITEDMIQYKTSDVP